MDEFLLLCSSVEVRMRVVHWSFVGEIHLVKGPDVGAIVRVMRRLERVQVRVRVTGREGWDWEGEGALCRDGGRGCGERRREGEVREQGRERGDGREGMCMRCYWC